MDALAISFVALWSLVLVLLILLLATIREVGALRRHVGLESAALATSDGPRIGDTAPRIRGTYITGGSVDLGPGNGPALVLFVSAHCEPCRKLLAEVPAYARTKLGQAMPLVLIGSGRREELLELTRLFALPVPIVFDQNDELMRRFDLHTTPYGVALDEEWAVRSKGIANGRAHLVALAELRIAMQGNRTFVPDGHTAGSHPEGGDVHGMASAGSR